MNVIYSKNLIQILTSSFSSHVVYERYYEWYFKERKKWLRTISSFRYQRYTSRGTDHKPSDQRETNKTSLYSKGMDVLHHSTSKVLLVAEEEK